MKLACFVLMATQAYALQDTACCPGSRGVKTAPRTIDTPAASQPQGLDAMLLRAVACASNNHKRRACTPGVAVIANYFTSIG